MTTGCYIDPSYIGEVLISGVGLWRDNRGVAEAAGKTLRSLTIDTSIRNCVLILAGQSNMSNEAPTAYTPTYASQVDNFNIYDRQMYAASGVLLGCGWLYTSLGGSAAGHCGGRIADGLIAAGKFDRVILAPVAIGATTVANWDIGGPLYNRIGVAIARLAQVGITPSLANTTFAVLWGQGESDGATVPADYQFALQRVISRAREYGHTGRFLVARQTMGSGITWPMIQAAQAAVVGYDSNVFAGANADIIDTSFRYPDGTHFSDSGAQFYANLWINALAATGAPF